MTDRASRIVFLLEILVLALPATIVYAVLLLAFFNAYGLLADVGPLSSEAGTIPWKGYMVLAAPAVFALGFSAFWVLATRFLVAGRESLARASPFLWVTAFLGQGIGIAVTLWRLVGDIAGVEMAGMASIMSLILLLLPPLIHMVVAMSKGSQQQPIGHA